MKKLFSKKSFEMMVKLLTLNCALKMTRLNPDGLFDKLIEKNLSHCACLHDA
jgi:hypothetical protein